MLIKSKEIVNDNVLDFYRFIYFNLFLKDKFDNILNIFDVNCNFNKKKARNLKEKVK